MNITARKLFKLIEIIIIKLYIYEFLMAKLRKAMFCSTVIFEFEIIMLFLTYSITFIAWYVTNIIRTVSMRREE